MKKVAVALGLLGLGLPLLMGASTPAPPGGKQPWGMFGKSHRPERQSVAGKMDCGKR
ncbi:MAG: hypothetical protein GXO13_01730 [Epsilonproteobacteria bacterium]|nr:hypothetical protein [Campylobacterota bacterium]